MRKWLAILLTAALLCAMPLIATAEGTELEPIKVSVAFVDNGMWDVNPENTYFGKEVKERFNLEVEPMVITWGDWKEKTSMWAASGQLPDYTLTFSDYFIWRDQGVSKGFPLETFDKYPNLKDRIPENVLEYLVDDQGMIYGVPRSSWRNSSEPTQAVGLYVNKRFLEKAGLSEPPTTMDGWYDFLKKCVDEDYSGVGTIGITADADIACGYLTQLPFMPMNTWVKENDKWTLKQLSDKNIEFLEYSRKLYKDGIIDKEIATRKGGDHDNLFNEGRVAVIASNADCDMMLRWVGPDKQLASDWTVLTTSPESPVDGVRYHNTLSNYDGVMAFNPNISDAAMDRILMVQDWACSPEGEKFVTLGVEGVHYQVDADGNYENLCKLEDGTLQAYWIHEPFAMFGRFVPTWNFEFAISSPLHPKANLDMAQQFFNNVRETNTIVDANWGIEYYASPARNNMPSITSDYTAMYLNVIMGDEDIETAFEAFRQQALVKVQEAIDDTNRYAQEKGW